MNAWDAVFAIDPGGTTGISCGAFPRRGSMKSRLQRGRKLWHGHLPILEARANVPNAYSDEMAAAFVIVQSINKFSESVKPLRVHVVVEGFVINRKPGSMKREGLSPVRIASSLEALLYLNAPSGMEWEQEPVYQLAAEAKGFVTDARLRDWGMWHVGKEHARDASRHLITKLAKLGNLGAQ